MAEKINYTLAYPTNIGRPIAKNDSPGAAAKKLANAVRRAHKTNKPKVLVVVVTDNRTQKKHMPYLVQFVERAPTAEEKLLPRFKDARKITDAKCFSLSRPRNRAAVMRLLKTATREQQNVAMQYMGDAADK